jgi:hypothetical protein
MKTVKRKLTPKAVKARNRRVTAQVETLIDAIGDSQVKAPPEMTGKLAHEFWWKWAALMWWCSEISFRVSRWFHTKWSRALRRSIFKFER